MSPVDTARRTQSLSATSAVRGISSESDRPGTVVAIGPKSPRTSAGASGFGSQVECWGGPPIRNRRMHDLARPNEGPAASGPCAPRRPPSQVGQVQAGPEHAEAADPQDFTAAQAVAKPGAGPEKSEHGNLAMLASCAVSNHC